MIKKLLSFLLLLLLQHGIFAQLNTTDDLILRIPQSNTSSTATISDYINKNYATDSARIRAIYLWVTNNINYDVAKLLARNTAAPTNRQTVEEVLNTRSAVCQGYADLFIDLCTRAGIPTVFIGGYTKRNGFVSPLAHAWVGAQLKGDWYLFDPTWGAGYLRNNEFIKAPNFKFYRVTPAQMIRDHMPFDPMYQFLNYTVTNKEFIDSKASINTGKKFFSFNDTLKIFNSLTQQQRARDETRRLEANGISNDLITDRLNFLKKGLSSHDFKDRYDEAGDAFKKSISLYNQYIEHKNKRFKVIEDQDLRSLMGSISNYMISSRSILTSLVVQSDQQRQAISALYSSLERFGNNFNKEKEFVEKYIRSDRDNRNRIFSRN